jgi:hypothetical protein
MKKILYNIAAGLLLLATGFSSCTKKIDEAYINPNADVRRPIEELLPGIIANMTISFSAQGTNFGTQNDAIYIGRYTQFWATSSTSNVYDKMGPAPFTSAANILGNVWGAHYYGQGENLNKMIEWGIEEKKWDYVGVGYAIRAWSWLTLTNIHGDVILKTAFQDRLTFPYDEQKEVYDEVRRLCHVALSYLEMNIDNASPANLAIGDQFMNGGDVEKWKKFTYAVLARSFNQLTNKSDYRADSVIEYSNKALIINADNTSAKWSNAGTTGTYSFFAPFRGNIGTIRQSRFIADLMSGLNPAFPTATATVPFIDPRAPYIIRENNNGTYKGVRPNKGTDGLVAADRPRGFWGTGWDTTTAPATDARARYIFKNAPIWPIVTASEVEFMKAEAFYRSGQKANALASYIEAINLNFDQLISDYEVSVPVAQRITPLSRAAYLGSPLVVPAESDFNLSHIMLQKYIALYGWGAIETWVDLRRYHYNLDTDNGLVVYRGFAPPSGDDLFIENNNKVVQRAFPRGSSEFYNQEELNKVGGNLIDYHTKEQWFSQQ